MNTASLQHLLNVKVARKIPENEDNLSFDQNSFNIFMLIENEVSLLTVYRKLDIDQQSFNNAIEKLFKQGLIFEVSEDQFVSVTKIELITASLAEYVGPVAKLIVADALAGLGVPEDEVPLNHLQLLIEKIVDQIPFEKALEFKENIEKMMVLVA